jgi:hypothetical protein
MPAARQVSGFEPPPSSILATHVVHGNGVPEFDRDNFDQLLAEALGSDEDGQPNLGADVAVNHKLICIVFQIGIERALEENPFRAPGKADARLRTCLEVLKLAVERSPQVVWATSDTPIHDATTKPCPLYSWLIPTLLPLTASTQAEEVRDAVLALFESLVDADGKCNLSTPSDTILGFLRATIQGQSPCQLVRDRLLTVYRNYVARGITPTASAKEGYHP